MNPQVEIVLRDPLNPQKQTSLWFNTFDTSISKKWVQALKISLKTNILLEKNMCFYGWLDNPRNLKFLCRKINESIQKINAFNHKNIWLKPYYIKELIDEENLDQEALNKVHHHFEILMGQVWNTSVFYAQADAETKYYIRQLNILCHQIEAYFISQASAERNHGLAVASLLVSYMNDGFNRYDLEAGDYNHFSRVRNFGDVFMFYCQSGKTHIEAFNDKDQSVYDNNINGHRYYSGEFVVHLGPDTQTDYIKNFENDFLLWLKSKGADVGEKLPPFFIDRAGQRQGLGWLKTAELDRTCLENLNKKQIQEHIAQFQDIYQIKIHETIIGLPQIIERTYPYAWIDKDFEEKQIQILSGKKMHESHITKDKSTFCVLPWSHMYGDELGRLAPCCMTVEAKNYNQDENGEPLKIYRAGDFEKHWNSPYMKKVRTQMLLGIRPLQCQKCFVTEDLGMPSHRQMMNKFDSKFSDHVFENASLEGTSSFKIQTVDVRVGNHCNLVCRMCSPTSSRGLLKEWKTIHPQPQENYSQYEKINWFSKPEYWDLLFKHIESIRSLYFAGGEPLIIPELKSFLAKIATTQHAKKIKLIFNTNLAILPEEYFQLWDEFKDIKIIVSLEGFKKVNDYIRHPSKWNILEKNLRRLNEVGKQNNRYTLSINTTVQAYNIFDLPNLIEFSSTQLNAFVPFPSLSLLNKPRYFSIQILPKNLKEQAALKLLDYKLENQSRWQKNANTTSFATHIEQRIDGVVKHMLEKDMSHLLPEFKRVTEGFDKSRKQRISDYIPELKTVFKGRENATTLLDCGV